MPHSHSRGVVMVSVFVMVLVTVSRMSARAAERPPAPLVALQATPGPPGSQSVLPRVAMSSIKMKFAPSIPIAKGRT